MKLRLTLVIGLLMILAGVPESGRTQGTSTSSGYWTSLPLSGATYVITGIKDIKSFLEQCPTKDLTYKRIRLDFELRLDGQVITSTIACTQPISTMPIGQFTDELIAYQVLRTAYYMAIGTEGKLPWTQRSLYTWMSSNIAGINIKTAPGQLYCCDIIDGKKYFSMSRQDATQRELNAISMSRISGCATDCGGTVNKPNLKPPSGGKKA